MEKTLSPKQMAQAIGSSESSIKRWCDRGLVRFTKTGGGHRRIPLVSVLEFARREGLSLVAPDALGLPSAAGREQRTVDQAISELSKALVEGKEDLARLVIWDLHLAKNSISAICDEVLMPVFESIGDAWCQGEVEVYEERRACEIANLAIGELRGAIQRPSDSAPVAMGATAAGDPYSLPTKMVELVLRQNGWNATSLGCNVPFESLSNAIREHQPTLFWLSVSSIQDEDAFVHGFNQLELAAGDGVVVAIGGRALTESVRSRLNYTVYCDKLKNLERFVASLNKPPFPV